MDLLCTYGHDFFDVGAWLTFVVGIITVIVEIRKSRKITFINTVTEARKEYITKFRKLVAEFCAVATTKTDENKLKALSYQLKLMINPAGYIGWWDDEATKLIDKIVENKGESDIDKFVVLMQSWFALEWHGMMNESRRGVLASHKKDELRKQFYFEYKKYLNYKHYD